MEIVNTNILKVKRLDKSSYLAGTTNIYILFLPKIYIYLDHENDIIKFRIKDFTKSLILNILFYCALLFTFFYIKSQQLELELLLYFSIGTIALLLIVNVLTIERIKIEVMKQIK